MWKGLIYYGTESSYLEKLNYEVAFTRAVNDSVAIKVWKGKTAIKLQKAINVTLTLFLKKKA